MKHVLGFRKVLFTALLIGISVFSFAAKGVPTAENGLLPTGKRYTLVLEENLRIGSEKGAEFLWTTVGTTVQTDKKGFMYVCDPKEKRITVINSDGDFVRHIGRPGQGPGEFQTLSSFQVLNDGRGVAFQALGPKIGRAHV